VASAFGQSLVEVEEGDSKWKAGLEEAEGEGEKERAGGWEPTWCVFSSRWGKRKGGKFCRKKGEGGRKEESQSPNLRVLGLRSHTSAALPR
jgi:hypothetical protein